MLQLSKETKIRIIAQLYLVEKESLHSPLANLKYATITILRLCVTLTTSVQPLRPRSLNRARSYSNG